MKRVLTKISMTAVISAALLCSSGCTDMIEDHLLDGSSLFTGDAELDAVRDTTLSFSASLNNTGNVYYAVVPDGSEKPTTDEIINEKVSGSVASGFSSIENSNFYFEVGGLAKKTDYDLYVVGQIGESKKDEVENEYTEIKKLDVKTISAYLISVSPQSGSTGVPLNTNITLTFSYPLDTATFGAVKVGSTTFVNEVNCTMTIDKNVLQINPAADFTAETTYTGLYIYSFKTSDGLELLHADSTYNFTTLGEYSQISSIIPADESTSVALDTNIIITFSTNLKTTSIGTVTLNTAGGSGNSGNAITYTNGSTASISVSGSTITVNPYGNLDNNQTYCGIRISGFSTALTGSAINYSDDDYNFTTIGSGVGIEEIIPNKGKTTVPVSASISIICDTALDASAIGTLTLNGTTYINGSNATISVQDTVITVDPVSDFSYSTTYSGISFSGFMAANGLSVSYSDSSYYFTTIGNGVLSNVYLLVDRSGSMGNNFAKYTFDVDTYKTISGVKYYTPIVVADYGVKWQMVQSMVKTDASIIVPNCNVGLATYAGSGTFNELIDLKPGNTASVLSTILDGISTTGGTDHAEAMLTTLNGGYLNFSGDSVANRKKVVVLITDGDSVSGTVEAATQLKNAGVPVYVVGLGNTYINKPSDYVSRGEENYQAVMQAIGTAAGTRNPYDSTRNYFLVSSAADFAQAINFIMSDY